MDIPVYEELFNLLNVHCWAVGIEKNKFDYRFFGFLIIFIPAIFEETAYAIKYMSTDLVKSLGAVPCICYCTLAVIKLITIALNWSKIKHLKESFKVLYTNINNEEKILVRREVIFVKLLVKYIYFLNFILACVYNISILIIIPYHYMTTNEVIYLLPFPVLLPFSTDEWIPWLVVFLHLIACSKY
jgi:hypothetical protein